MIFNPIYIFRWRLVISFASCFAGGVFIAACLLDLLPDVEEKIQQVSHCCKKPWSLGVREHLTAAREHLTADREPLTGTRRSLAALRCSLAAVRCSLAAVRCSLAAVRCSVAALGLAGSRCFFPPWVKGQMTLVKWIKD